ncbi:MAG TPA: AAA family ATPase [Mycobacteriales bacterium]|nr:AAA family ATPase [Mycobacteriales bacterium]
MRETDEEVRLSRLDDELAREQAHVDVLYHRLDLLRTGARDQLRDLRAQGGSGTHQWRYERDVFAARHEERLGQLDAVEHNLCFGAVDRTDGTRDYVGRIGLADDSHNRLLVDWRAPAAAPFYQATPVEPLGLVRRRHLRTRDRQVVSVDDDLLDGTRLTDSDRRSLSGEAALLASVTAPRTGQMGDIVATIQAEQDKVIRSDLAGVLVVDGGPGTGKTAVALHRAAYLLYTHRDRLANRGVLVVGPNDRFLRYIEAVLPALGETDVVLVTPGRLFPGLVATLSEPAEVAAVKGDPRMAQVVAAAVRDRQRVPAREIEIDVDGVLLRLTRDTCERARTRARRSRKPHNAARGIFLREVLTALARQLHPRDEPLEDDDLAGYLDELRASTAVYKAVAPLWARLTPEQLLREMYDDPRRLAVAGRVLSDRERELLRRPAAETDEWSTADITLLDEAAELLGEIPKQRPKGESEEQREAARYAEGVAEMTGVAGVPGVDGQLLARRYQAQHVRRSAAEHATLDRSWAFGHVVIDEAQELSPMQWRAILRRCPSRSMTIVGDLAQAAGRWGPTTWAELLDEQVAGRWRVSRLTINYRTPAEIMAVAEEVLAEIDPTATAPSSVRSSGSEPSVVSTTSAGVCDAVRDVVAATLAEQAGGQLAVIAPAALVRELTAALPEDERVSVVTVADVKGLEYDDVVLVEPGAIVADSDRGNNDLYVALSRATQRLTVVHAGDLPKALARLVG